MELYFLFSAHCVDFLILLVVFGLSIISYKFLAGKHNRSAKLPPGKIGWPVVGETLEFSSLGRKGVPEFFFQDRMKIFSKEIFRTGLFGESLAVFCGPAGNKFLFSNENKLVRSWWPKSVKTIFPVSEQTTSREDIKSFYSLFPKYLSLETLQTYIGTMDSMAKQHFEDNWENNEEVIVYPLVRSYAFVLACHLFISVDDPSHIQKLSEPFHMLEAGLISVPINLPGTSFHRAVKAAAYLRKELVSIIKQRKIDLSEKNASPTQDILSHMLHDYIDDSGKLMNETDIASQIIGLIFGGHDVVALTTTLIVKYLGELPEIYEKVLKEQLEIAESKEEGEMLNWGDIQKMKYSWNMVKEVLRLAPPATGTFREAITDFTFAGYTIPKGWKLYWNVHSTNRNPEYFPNPEKFDPTRFEGKGPAPYTFVPFGGGPRTCPGREYARLEILVFIHNLVTRYRWEKSIPGEKVIYDPKPLPTNGLPIRLQPIDPKKKGRLQASLLAHDKK